MRLAQVLTFFLAIMYLTTAILSGISVGAGVEDHMSFYQGQVQVNANYTVTPVDSSTLAYRCGAGSFTVTSCCLILFQRLQHAWERACAGRIKSHTSRIKPLQAQRARK